MELELDELEVQAKQEIKARRTRALGLLRIDLITQCRKHLLYIAVARKQALATKVRSKNGQSYIRL
jgi:hypothetical protein